MERRWGIHREVERLCGGVHELFVRPILNAMSEDPKSSITDKERLDYAWKHFALIADQRMKTFNFYVIILAGTFTGTVAALMRDGIHRRTFCLIGTAHLLISVIFALIDIRSCRILRISADALAAIERSPAFAGQPLLIEEDRIRNKKGVRHFISYRWAFLLAFAAQFVFGVLLAWTPRLLAYPLSNRQSPPQEAQGKAEPDKQP